MEISLLKKNNMKNQNSAFFTPYLSREKFNFYGFHIIR